MARVYNGGVGGGVCGYIQNDLLNILNITVLYILSCFVVIVTVNSTLCSSDSRLQTDGRGDESVGVV